jgi:hypothetical protein
MDVKGGWLGEFVGGKDLVPGDLFIGIQQTEFLGLFIRNSMNGPNIVVLVDLQSAPQPRPDPPRIGRYEFSPYSGDIVRRIPKGLVLEPCQVGLEGGLSRAGDTAPSGFAVLPDGSLAIQFVLNGSRLIFGLTNGAHHEAGGVVYLPPQRLLWMDGDDGLELCRF